MPRRSGRVSIGMLRYLPSATNTTPYISVSTDSHTFTHVYAHQLPVVSSKWAEAYHFNLSKDFKV
jgi:hypothetical protein